MSEKPPDKSGTMDTDGFVIPTAKRGRGRPRKKRIDEDTFSVSSFNSDNTFDDLPDDDEGNGLGQRKRLRETKTKRPPPLIVRNLNYKDVEKTLEGIKVKNITKRITKAGTKLYVTSNEEHKALRSHLDTSKTKYTTYTLDDEKFSRYVMYGLPVYDTREVHAAIKDTLKINPTDVKQMKITKKQYPEQANYMIYFKKGQNVTIRDLQKVRGILGFHVFFDRYKRTSDPCQCYNCQEFTHASSNCTLDPRCVRCGESHKSMNCDKIDATTKKVPDHLLKCANCGGNHTASSRNCPERLKLIKKRHDAIKQRANNDTRTQYVRQFNNYNDNFPSFQSNTHVNNVNNRTTLLPYASAVKSSTTINNPSGQTNSNILRPSQLMQIFREIVNICSTCKSKEEQLIALSTIVEKYVLDD